MSLEAVPNLELTAPLAPETIPRLRVGQRVILSGVVYTARDAAHRRLAEALQIGQELPIPVAGQVIYYVGPAPTRPGDVIGPAGPTTAGRVDLYTPALLEHGLKGMIGKGKRNAAVRQAIITYAAVYFVMVGGAAALIAQCIKRASVVAYQDLGPEAIYRLEVEALPMVVANDMYGADLFEIGQAEFRRGARSS